MLICYLEESHLLLSSEVSLAMFFKRVDVGVEPAIPTKSTFTPSTTPVKRAQNYIIEEDIFPRLFSCEQKMVSEVPDAPPHYIKNTF
nr:hypothetical protein [Tanacetum cinerariifolium]